MNSQNGVTKYKKVIKVSQNDAGPPPGVGVH